MFSIDILKTFFVGDETGGLGLNVLIYRGELLQKHIWVLSMYKSSNIT